MLKSQLAVRLTWATMALKVLNSMPARVWHVQKTLLPRIHEATCALGKGQAG